MIRPQGQRSAKAEAFSEDQAEKNVRSWRSLLVPTDGTNGKVSPKAEI
jgi:hypothetical protein